MDNEHKLMICFSDRPQIVQSHVHGDETREQRWSKVMIDCELTVLKPFARRVNDYEASSSLIVNLDHVSL